jgi:hypothetical protein
MIEVVERTRAHRKLTLHELLQQAVGPSGKKLPAHARASIMLNYFNSDPYGLRKPKESATEELSPKAKAAVKPKTK